MLDTPQPQSVPLRAPIVQENLDWEDQPGSEQFQVHRPNCFHDCYAQAAVKPINIRDELDSIRQYYVFKSDAASLIVPLKNVPVLSCLLKEAIAPLRQVFGNEPIFQLETLHDEDDSVLRVVVHVPPNSHSVVDKMKCFKSTWWFNNCSRSEASLIFDYEIGDGI